jgi:hypothetical protein
MKLSPEPSLGFSTSFMPGVVNGYHPTLTTLLGHFLWILEQRYGPRDRRHTILGIEFSKNEPQIWFPGNRSHVAIQLGDEARLNPKQAVFQLAHETVHLLAPARAYQTLAVEEGLATLFSHEISKEYGLAYRNGSVPYQHCEQLLVDWLAIAPHAIKETRILEPDFWQWTANLLSRTVVGTPEALALALTEKFTDVKQRLQG